MEAVIAVSVLAIMFAGVLQLFTRSVSTLRTTNDAAIAAYLAQDAAEFLYAKRRYNKDISTTDNGWIAGIIDAGTCPGNTKCGVDTSRDSVADGDLLPCIDSSMNNCQLFVRQDGAYTHTATNASSTPFTRTIEASLTEGDATTPLAVRATTTVSWTASGGRIDEYVLPIMLYAK